MKHFSGLTRLIHEAGLAEFGLAFISAILNGAALFSVIMYAQPLETTPKALIGFYAYTHDIAITNRLFGISIFMLAVLILLLPALALWHAIPQKQHERALRLFGFSMLPGLIWLSGILLTKQTQPQLYWLILSAKFCWIVPALMIFESKDEKRSGTAELALLTLGLSFFVGPALLVFLRSGLCLAIPGFRANAQEILAVGAGIIEKLQYLPACLICLIYLLRPRVSTLRKGLLFPIQLCLLLFFCLALPGVYRTNIEVVQFYGISRPFVFFVLPLMLIGIVSCVRCAFTTQPVHGAEISTDDSWNPRTKISCGVSAVSLLALLFFFLFNDQPLPGFSAYNMVDNFYYEFGHRYSTIWMSLQRGAKLFADVIDSWGLWDSFQFQLGWFMSGCTTAAASAYGQFLFNIILVIIQFLLIFTLYRNPLIACFLTLLFGYDVSAAMLIYFLIIFYPPLLKRRSLWLILWAALSIFFPFFKNPQGTMLVAGSLPLAVWQLIGLFRENRRKFALTLIPLFVMALMLRFWPLGDYFVGLVEMYLETGSINADWGALDWVLDSHILLNALIGNLLIVLPALLLLLTILIWRAKQSHELKTPAMLLCLSAGLIAFISLSYSWSRTDYSSYQRQFTMLCSLVFAVGSLLTAFYFNRKSCMAFTLLLLTLNLLNGRELISPAEFVTNGNKYDFVSESKIINAESEYGLSNVGIGVFPRDYIEEESAIKSALDKVLDADESFLNLTVNGSHYYISERDIPTEYSTYYDFVGETSELRGLQQLQEKGVVTALVDPTMLEYSPASFRTYHLYRYAVLDRYPWKIGQNKVLLMPKEYFGKAGVSCPDDAERLTMLDELFPEDIWGNLPTVLGRSADNLLAGAVLLDAASEINRTEDGINVAFAEALDGSAAGLLSFELELPEGVDSAEIELSWTNSDLPDEINRINFGASSGCCLIPLDFSPRWLLAQHIEQLSLSAHNGDGESIELALSDLQIYQR